MRRCHPCRVNPEPIARWDAASLAEELRRQLLALEAMFDDPGLDALRQDVQTHPAVSRYDLLRSLVARNGSFAAAEETDVFLSMSAAMLDRMTWAADPVASDYWDVIPDADTREFVRRRLRLPQFFDDVAAELFYWGWLRSVGFDVERGEAEGLPDLQVARAGATVWADVKRIHVGTAPKRVRRVIAKASKQIQRAEPGEAGVAMIHIARSGLRAAFDDRVPSDVEPYVLGG